MPLVRRGNSKLGDVYAVSLSAGRDETCPGATDLCESVCYAARIAAERPNVAAAWARDTALLLSDPGEYERQLHAELSRLAPGSVIRIHTSGDMISGDHVRLWDRIACSFPALSFFTYTRSWRDATIALELELFARRPNVRVWASTDAETGPAPAGWLSAALIVGKASSDAVICLEQTGRRSSCSDCGLCWRVRPDSEFRLGFRDCRIVARERR